MCNKHVPILVYDTGGTQLVCEKCGKPLGNWTPNGKDAKDEKDAKRKDTVQAVHS